MTSFVDLERKISLSLSLSLSLSANFRHFVSTASTNQQTTAKRAQQQQQTHMQSIKCTLRVTFGKDFDVKETWTLCERFRASGRRKRIGIQFQMTVFLHAYEFVISWRIKHVSIIVLSLFPSLQYCKRSWFLRAEKILFVRLVTCAIFLTLCAIILPSLALILRFNDECSTP